MIKTPSLSELRLDPDKHQYWWGKKRIPGVNEILQKVGISKDYKNIDPFYRDRGIATHKAIELHLKGVLDPASLDEAVKPHFEAFKTYWGNRFETILAIEQSFCDTTKSFAGTPDLVTDKAIYDWKCSKSHDKAAELQGQAYKNIVIHNWPSLRQSLKDMWFLPFIVVELHDDGRPVEFDYGTSCDEWPSVMSLYRWRTR